MRAAAWAFVLATVLLVVLGLSPSASAGIGRGSKMTVESQTQMLFQTGGGYVDWEISAPVATEVRGIVDRELGNGDGNVTPAEAQAYITEMDLILESSITYGSARIIRSSLLNKDITTDTSGLIGPVNSSRAIEIHFTFSANLRNEGATADFGDQRIPMAPIRALDGAPGLTFEGELEWRHTEIVVGMGSFSRLEPDRGHFSRFRGPGLEMLWFSLSVQNQTSKDRARFDTFSVVQCPLELFIVVCVFGVFTLWSPRHFLRAKKKLKVRWLHLLAILLVVLALALFFIGTDGAVIWTVAPLLAVLSFVLSWGIYSAGWKGIAKSSVPVVPARPAVLARRRPEPDGGGPEAEPVPPSPVAKVTTAEQWAENLPVVMGEAIPVAAPSPVSRAPPPGAAGLPGPAPSPVAGRPPLPPGAANAPAPSGRDLRCPRCKGTFSVRDPGTRPLAIRCTLCGAEGVLRK